MYSKRKKSFKMENLESEFDSNGLVSSTPITNKKRRISYLNDSEVSLESLSSVYFSYGSPNITEFMSPVRKQFPLDCTESGLRLKLKSSSQDSPKEILTDDRSFVLNCKESSSVDHSIFDFSVDDNYSPALEKCIPRNSNIRKSHSYSRNDPMNIGNSSDCTLIDSKADSTVDKEIRHREMLQQNSFDSSKSSQVLLSSLLHENTVSSSTSSNINPLTLLSASSPANINECWREKVNIKKSMSEYVVHKNSTSLTAACRSNSDSTVTERNCLGKIESSPLGNKPFGETQVEDVKWSDVLGSFTTEYKNILDYNQSQNTMFQTTENINTGHSIPLFKNISASGSLTTRYENGENVSSGEINNSDLENRITITPNVNEFVNQIFKKESMQKSKICAEDDYIFPRVPDFQRNQETSSIKIKDSEKGLEFSREENTFEKCDEITNADNEYQVPAFSIIPATNGDANENNERRNEVMELGEVIKHTVLRKTPGVRQIQEISKKDNTFSDNKPQFSQMLNLLEKCTEDRTTDIESRSLSPEIITTNSNLCESSNTAAESIQFSDGFTDNSTDLPKSLDIGTNQVISNKEESSTEKSENLCEDVSKLELENSSSIGICVNINVYKDLQTLVTKSISTENNNVSRSKMEDSKAKTQGIHGNLSEINNPAAESKQFGGGFIEDNTILLKNQNSETNPVMLNKEVSSCFDGKSGNSCKYFWEAELEESSTSEECVDSIDMDKDTQTLAMKSILIVNNNINRSIRKDSYSEIQENKLAEDDYIFPMDLDPQQNQETSSKKINCSEKELEFSREENIFEKCNEVIYTKKESEVSLFSMIPVTNSGANGNNETRSEVMELSKVEKVTILPKPPGMIKTQEISKTDNTHSDSKVQCSQILRLLEKSAEDGTADIGTQPLAPKIIPAVNGNLYKNCSNTVVKSLKFSDEFTENSTILPKNLDGVTSQVITNKEESSSFVEKLNNSCEELWKLELEKSSSNEACDDIKHDKDSQALAAKSISIVHNKVSLRRRGYSYKEIHGNNLDLNETGLYCISKPKADIRILLDLFEVDNDVSKCILVALSQEHFMKGVTQTEMFNFLRRDAKPGTITKLKQDIGMFLKAAVNAEIIERKNRRYYLKLKTRSYKSDRSMLKELTAQKRKIFTSTSKKQ